MYMKNHILAALREEFDHWEKVLASLSETQIMTVLPPSELSVKDEISHLWAWQQRSIARMEAAQHNREPELPQWLPGVDPEEEGHTNQINAWIYETYHDQPWSVVHQQWQEGFLQLVALGEAISEPILLAAGQYGWFGDHPLAFVLIASYDHHQEHLDKLLARIGQPGN